MLVRVQSQGKVSRPDGCHGSPPPRERQRPGVLGFPVSPGITSGFAGSIAMLQTTKPSIELSADARAARSVRTEEANVSPSEGGLHPVPVLAAVRTPRHAPSTGADQNRSLARLIPLPWVLLRGLASAMFRSTGVYHVHGLIAVALWASAKYRAACPWV